MGEWVCAKEVENDEYPWGIDPTLPHEHGEPQAGMYDTRVDEPCDCTPVWMTTEEFNRRRQGKLDEVMQDF